MKEYLNKLQKKFPYAYSLIGEDMWIWIYNNCIKNETK
jgi:hypothetical protein